MAVRVAINGFGRIGRNILRAIIESGRKDLEVVLLNDLGPVETNAHLLRYDTVHGRFPHEVKVDGDTIDVGRGKMKVTAERDPAKLPPPSASWSPRRLTASTRRSCSASTTTSSPRSTSSCPTARARPIAWRRWRRS